MNHEALFIGLRQIGTSIAMNFARSDADLTLVGHDTVKEHTRRAKELGAIDRFESNPDKAVESADMVILDVPAIDVHDHLQMIGRKLKPTGIVIDTSPARSQSIKWVEEFIPADRHYLGVTPIIGAHILFSEEEDITQPRLDLFQNGLMAIVVPKTGSEEAVAVGLDLARLLGVTPIFIDADEHDGITTTVEWLPRLISAAILHEASEAGNWPEIQRMAGTTFASITSLWSEKQTMDSKDFHSLNREILRLKLQHFIGELQKLDRALADESGSSLCEYISSARATRAHWLSARKSKAQIRDGRRSERIPERRSMIDKLLGFHLPDDRN